MRVFDCWKKLILIKYVISRQKLLCVPGDAYISYSFIYRYTEAFVMITWARIINNNYEAGSQDGYINILA